MVGVEGIRDAAWRWPAERVPEKWLLCVGGQGCWAPAQTEGQDQAPGLGGGGSGSGTARAWVSCSHSSRGQKPARVGFSPPLPTDPSPAVQPRWAPGRAGGEESPVSAVGQDDIHPTFW